MSQTKSKKLSSSWAQCESCMTNLLNKDIELHSLDCPPKCEKQTLSYHFVKDSNLYGLLGIKNQEEIKNVSSKDKDFLVFLSQDGIQLTNLCIGENCIIEPLNNKDLPPVARIVFPTVEKTVTSVLLTRSSHNLTSFEPDQHVKVSKLNYTPKLASLLTLVILNGPKSLEITPEINNRIIKMHTGKLLTVRNIISIMYYGKIVKFEVKSIEGVEKEIDEEFSRLSIKNTEFYTVNDKTKTRLFSDNVEYDKSISFPSLLSKIAGLNDEISEIKECANACFGSSKLSSLTKCRSILLYGNSGTGKSMLANAVSQEFKANIVNICASDVYSKNNGNVEDSIKDLFSNALTNTPSIIILDEVDLLCPSRSSRISETEKRITSTMLQCFDSIKDQKLFIIATTNKIDNIDSSFRRFGRLEKEVEIPTPNSKDRKLILLKLLENVSLNFSDEELLELAMNTHGFVGADLVSLCSRAGLNAAKRNDDTLIYDDFKLALTKVRPSAMREVQIEVPNVKWTDIGGQDNLKLILKQAVEWPLKYASSFQRLGVTPPKGVLMYGPPGCSKTMIAKALATESGLNFLSIKGPELFSKWVGESERAVREVFRKARQVAPSIIFFDEIDALCCERGSNSNTSVQERVLGQLLTELDGVTPLTDVTVLGATNRPDKIDRALLRPGRLDRLVYVPLPGIDTRREILKIKFKKMPVQDVTVEELLKLTDGYSGAELVAICQEAAMMALEEDLNTQHVTKRHFSKALDLIKPRTPESLIKLYDDFINVKL